MSKPIRFHRSFQKSYKKRILSNSKLSQAFDKRYAEFALGKRGAPLNDHPLTGKLAGKRAFSISGDLRVIYKESSEVIYFVDIGTHNQVYK